MRLEQCEAREVPAVYNWTGWVSTDPTDLSNWMVQLEVTPGEPPPPPPGLPGGDDELVFGPLAVDPFTGHARDCVGLTSATDSFAAVRIVSGYTGTVSLGESLTVGVFSLADGAISQPSSGTDITVTGFFTWTGGTLNSSNYTSTLHLLGATATINPGTGNTITTGSTLSLESNGGVGAAAEFNPGILVLDNDASLTIDAFCTAQVKPQPNAEVKFTANVTTIGPNRVLVKAGGTLTVTGPGVWTGDWLPFENQGGAVEIANKADVSFGPLIWVGPPAAFITQTAGILKLHSGTTLSAPLWSYTSISGGELRIIADSPVGETAPAQIGGHLSMTGGIVTFTGAKWTLYVTGDVSWTGGTFKPRVDVADNGASDNWHIGGTLTVTTAAKVAPVTENYNPTLGLPANLRRLIVWADQGISGLATVESENPSYQIYITQPGGNRRDWSLGPNVS